MYFRGVGVALRWIPPGRRQGRPRRGGARLHRGERPEAGDRLLGQRQQAPKPRVHIPQPLRRHHARKNRGRRRGAVAVFQTGGTRLRRGPTGWTLGG